MASGDRHLARRLARDARLAERHAARAARAHARAVARREQVRRQARHRLPSQIVACVGAFVAAVFGLGYLPWRLIAVVAGLLALRSVLRLWRPVAVPVNPALAAPRVPPPPDVKSAAF